MLETRTKRQNESPRLCFNQTIDSQLLPVKLQRLKSVWVCVCMCPYVCTKNN